MDIFGSEENVDRWYAGHEHERAIEHALQRAAEAKHRGDVNAHAAMQKALLAYNLIDYTLLLGDALVLNNDPKVAEILEKLSAQIQAARALATPALALAEGKE